MAERNLQLGPYRVRVVSTKRYVLFVFPKGKAPYVIDRQASMQTIKLLRDTVYSGMVTRIYDMDGREFFPPLPSSSDGLAQP